LARPIIDEEEDPPIPTILAQRLFETSKEESPVINVLYDCLTVTADEYKGKIKKQIISPEVNALFNVEFSVARELM
jgi:hypothetical protein